MPSWEYMTSFIQAYYLPEEDLVAWVLQHPEYNEKVLSSFAKVGRAADDLTNKDKKRLEQRILDTHQRAKNRNNITQ